MKRWMVFFVVAAAAGMAVAFWEVWPSWMRLVSPDDSPLLEEAARAWTAERFLSGEWAFVPQRLIQLIAPSVLHDAKYAVCQIFFGASIVYTLRVARCAWPAAAGGGLFALFSGYWWTLFSAGHYGLFVMAAAFFWSLGFLRQAFATGKAVYFAVAAVTAMWGLLGQPDVGLLCLILLCAYTLWRMWREIRSSGVQEFRSLEGTGNWKLKTKNWALGIVLAGAVAGVIGMSGARMLTGQMGGRDEQIAQQAASGHAEEETPETARQKAKERFIFATNWSLPPADVAEMVIPGIFGDSRHSRPHVYWGAIGRPYEFVKRKMSPNYRQHTIYVGFLTLFMAVFGVVAWVQSRKRSQEFRSSGVQNKVPPEASNSEFSYDDVPFWAGVWIVTLVLAMGRYTPLYKIFYAIPFMDYLRAPLKFYHLTELATAMLAGYGLHALWRDSDGRLTKIMAIAAGGCAVFFGVTATVLSGYGAAMTRHITELGLAPVAESLARYAIGNTWRQAGIALLCAIALAALARFHLASRNSGVQKSRSSEGKRNASGGLPSSLPAFQPFSLLFGLLILIGAADLVMVSRRYVEVINSEPFVSRNALVQDIHARTLGRRVNVANYVSQPVWGQDWLHTSLRVNGLHASMPEATDPHASEWEFYRKYQQDPRRYWEVTGTRFVVLPRQMFSALGKESGLTPLAAFDYDGRSIRTAEPSRGTVILAERKEGALPFVTYEWQNDGEGGYGTLDMKKEPVTFDRMRGERDVLTTRATLTLPQKGLVVWNEKYDPSLEARVDGEKVPIGKVDGLWCGVEVPAGTHTLTARISHNYTWNLLSFLIGVSVLAWLWKTKIAMRCEKTGQDTGENAENGIAIS